MPFFTRNNSLIKVFCNTEVITTRKTKIEMDALIMVDKKAQTEQLCLSLPWNTLSEWKWFKATIPEKRKKTENKIIRIFLQLLILASLYRYWIIRHFFPVVNGIVCPS